MDDMNEKYQKHYSQLLTSTLTENILKGISFQANIKLANEIIEDQDKMISQLKTDNEVLKSNLEELELKVNDLKIGRAHV